jgi:glucose/arabinose dehydrogenase
VTSGKYQAIWALGCRNPFTFAFSRKTGEMLINDVGGKSEEINRGIAGANFGWPTVEHGPSGRSDFVDPIHIYPQSSINGGDFADDVPTWPEWYRDRYYFADFVQGWIRSISPAAPEQVVDFATGIRRPVDLRFSPDGSLYVLLRNAWVVDDKFVGGTGSVVRISYKD